METLADLLPDSFENREKILGLLPQDATIEDLAKHTLNAQDRLSSTRRVPTDTDSPEEWKKFYRSLGAPEDPDQYPTPATDDKILADLAGKLKPKAHELGLTSKQYDELMATAASELGNHRVAVDNQIREASDRWLAESKEKYGARFEEISATAAQWFQKLVDSDPIVNMVMEQTGLGNHPAFIELAAKVADVAGDDMVPGGEERQAQTGHTVDQAREVAHEVRKLAVGLMKVPRGPERDNALEKFYELQKKLTDWGYDGAQDERLTTKGLVP